MPVDTPSRFGTNRPEGLDASDIRLFGQGSDRKVGGNAAQRGVIVGGSQPEPSRMPGIAAGFAA